MHCMKCGVKVEVYFNVMLCDDCIDTAVASDKLRRAHVRLGETGHVENALSVDELEQIWRK